MDDLWIGFINRGTAVASQVSFKFVAQADYMDGTFINEDSANYGVATQVLPDDDTTFRVVDQLSGIVQRASGLPCTSRSAAPRRAAEHEAHYGRHHPTFVDDAAAATRTGPTARAHLTWARVPLRFALSYCAQVLDPSDRLSNG